MEIEENIPNDPSEMLPIQIDEKKEVVSVSPDSPPWNVLEAIGVWFASVLFILIVPTVLLLPYLSTRTPPLTDSSQMAEFAKSDPTAIVLQIIAIIPAHLLTILVAWLVVTRNRKFPFRATLGWQRGGFRWWHYIFILGSFMVLAAVVGYFFPEQENDLLRILKSSRSAVYIVAFVATFTAPIVEEVIYRGVLYSGTLHTVRVSIRTNIVNFLSFISEHFSDNPGFLFDRIKNLLVTFHLFGMLRTAIVFVEPILIRYAIPIAFVFSSLLFALVHVPQYYPSYSTIFLLGILSVTLTSIRVVSKNLLPCIILHTLFNAMQSVFLIIEPFVNVADAPQPASIFHLFK